MVDAVYTQSGTALHTAVHRERPLPVLCALIKLGVDCSARNAAGQTAADVARENGLKMHAQLLKGALRPSTSSGVNAQRAPSHTVITRRHCTITSVTMGGTSAATASDRVDRVSVNVPQTGTTVAVSRTAALGKFGLLMCRLPLLAVGSMRLYCAQFLQSIATWAMKQGAGREPLD